MKFFTFDNSIVVLFGLNLSPELKSFEAAKKDDSDEIELDDYEPIQE